MQKILRYSVADLCADVEGVSAAITHACRQPSGPYRVRGLVQVDDEVFIQLLPAAAGRTDVYRFAEACDVTEADVVALLTERWTAGFDCVGSVSTGDGLYLFLFARPEGAA